MSNSETYNGLVIVFEGPDKSGKTTIAKEFAKRTCLPYFKSPQERQQRIEGVTRQVTKYVGMYVAELLQVCPIACIFDRQYPSEYAYSKVLGRPYDLDLIQNIDRLFSLVGAFIIICVKRDYSGYTDETTSNELLPLLAKEYLHFSQWTKCHCLILYTDDEELDLQCETILHFISERIE